MGKYTTANMKAWRKVTLLLALALVSTCFVAAHPGHDRLANENAINKNNGFVQNGDIVEQMSAELLGAVKERHKRLSDQRRAELETLMALSKMTGKFMNVSRGGRQLDTAKWQKEALRLRNEYEESEKIVQTFWKTRLQRKRGISCC